MKSKIWHCKEPGCNLVMHQENPAFDNEYAMEFDEQIEDHLYSHTQPKMAETFRCLKPGCKVVIKQEEEYNLLYEVVIEHLNTHTDNVSTIIHNNKGFYIHTPTAVCTAGLVDGLEPVELPWQPAGSAATANQPCVTVNKYS